MKKLKILIILFVLFASKLSLSAAAPSWTVEENLYGNTMTVTGIIELKDNTSSTELTDPDNILAAFVGTECRGVTNLLPSTALGHSYAYIMVMSNTNDEIINFKVYIKSLDKIVSITDSVLFKSDAILGSQTNPYVFSDQTVNEALIKSVSLGIANEIVTIDSKNNQVNISLPVGSKVTEIIPNIVYSNGSKVLYNGISLKDSTKFNFANSVGLTVVAQNGHTTNWTIMVDFVTAVNSLRKDQQYAFLQDNGTLVFNNVPEHAQYSVYTISGKLIASSKIDKSFSFASFPRSIYIIKAFYDQKLLFTQKVIY